ncbi:MAG: GTPase, partial [Clostridia bacterium]|nr:GTPase [Clostridia bacterium]
MEKTPLAFRTHVSIFGNTNAGKSSLFNKLIGQDMVIVSPEKGTTTDPVTKAMELLPYGP